MNQSSAGDQLGISVDRKPKTETNISINGYFNVLHTCGKTGEVKDYSGSNSISEDGLDRMFNGIAGSSATSANTAGPYLLFSNGSPTVTRAGAHTLQTALEVFDTAASSNYAVVGTGATEMWTLSGTDSVFGNETVGITSFTGTLVSEQLVLSCDATGTINSIQVVDRAGTPASSTVLASRSVGGTAASDQMSLITVNSGDTLTVTYTLSIQAT